MMCFCLFVISGFISLLSHLSTQQRQQIKTMWSQHCKNPSYPTVLKVCIKGDDTHARTLIRCRLSQESAEDETAEAGHVKQERVLPLTQYSYLFGDRDAQLLLKNTPTRKPPCTLLYSHLSSLTHPQFPVLSACPISPPRIKSYAY